MSNSVHIFVTATDVKKWAPGADVTISDATIYPYLHPSHKVVASIVGIELFNMISNEMESTAKKYLTAAVVNRIMYDYKLFETIQKRQSSKVDTYKYELQAMQDAYLGFYFDAIDSLIGILNANSEKYVLWKQSAAYKCMESLLLQSTDEFNAHYGIDGSDYFFFSSVFLQEKVIDKHLSGFDLPSLSESQQRRLKSVVAMFTVAYALRQFDITMLPRSLRNPSADGAYRHATSEQNTMYDLSEYLFGQAEAELDLIRFELNKPEEGADLQSTSNLNDPRKKFFLFS